MKKLLLYPLFLSFCLCFNSSYAAETPTPDKENTPKEFKYQVKNFDHLLGKIKGLDDALLKMHFKLYEGYVNNSNILLQKIQALSNSGQGKSPEFAALKRHLGWEFDGMLLHEYYFENLGGDKPLDTNSPLYAKIKADFGSFDAWKTDFISTGLMRGIGWVVSYVDPKEGRIINEWINEHDLGHIAGATPLLIMDVFEHAYITQFALDRNKYIEVFFNNIDWSTVARRYKAVKSPI